MNFPVENNAKAIFVRHFYDLFFVHFRDQIIKNEAEPGVIYRGPPGVGKVNVHLGYIVQNVW